MTTKFTPADMLGMEMGVLTRLIVHLDERGVADGQAFLVELLQLGRGLPAGQGAAQDLFCRQMQTQLETSRVRRAPPTAGKH